MPRHQTLSSIGIHTRGLVNILVSAREYEFSEFWAISIDFHSPDGAADKSLPLFSACDFVQQVDLACCLKCRSHCGLFSSRLSSVWMHYFNTTENSQIVRHGKKVDSDSCLYLFEKQQFPMMMYFNLPCVWEV